jgi:thymidylate synthase (FAD)
MDSGHTIKVHDHGFVRYIDHMGTDERIVEAARISYKSPSKGPEADAKLLKYLLANRHTSPFEMVKVTFNIKLPIFIMRQYVRHRMQNLNEVSARYTELQDEFFMPNKWRVQQTTGNKQGSVAAEMPDKWHKEAAGHAALAYKFCYTKYESLLKMGVAREMARIVLPVGIYTEIYATWDLNNLIKFFILRDDSHAQSEIQDYATAMKKITGELFPATMALYEEMRTAPERNLHEATHRVLKLLETLAASAESAEPLVLTEEAVKTAIRGT